MVMLQIREEVFLKLQQIARERQQTVEEVVEELADQVTIPITSSESKPQSATLADIAQVLLELDFNTSEVVNTSEHTNEIMQTEYADYIAQRKLNQDAKSNSDG